MNIFSSFFFSQFVEKYFEEKKINKNWKNWKKNLFQNDWFIKTSSWTEISLYCDANYFIENFSVLPIFCNSQYILNFLSNDKKKTKKLLND